MRRLGPPTTSCGRTWTGRPKQDLFLVGDIPAAGSLNGVIIPFFNALTKTNYAGIYWPHLRVADPVGLTSNSTLLVPPSGAIAGIFARTDGRRGVFKAPAGVEATVNGIVGLERNLIDGEQDDMNPIGLNAIRPMPTAGTVVWGARTLMPASEWRYVPVRRTAMFLRKSIYNGIQFAVFEPNDTNLWDLFAPRSRRSWIPSSATEPSPERRREMPFRQSRFRDDDSFGSSRGRRQHPGRVRSLRPAEFVVVRLSQKTVNSA